MAIAVVLPRHCFGSVYALHEENLRETSGNLLAGKGVFHRTLADRCALRAPGLQGELLPPVAD